MGLNYRTVIRGLIKNRGRGRYARGGEVTNHPMGSPVSVLSLGAFAMSADVYAKYPPTAGPVCGRPTHWNVEIIDGIAYGQQEWSE